MLRQAKPELCRCRPSPDPPLVLGLVRSPDLDQSQLLYCLCVLPIPILTFRYTEVVKIILSHCEFLCSFLILLFSFSQPHLLHMEVPGLEDELELQLQACTTAVGNPLRQGQGSNLHPHGHNVGFLTS